MGSILEGFSNLNNPMILQFYKHISFPSCLLPGLDIRDIFPLDPAPRGVFSSQTYFLIFKPCPSNPSLSSMAVPGPGAGQELSCGHPAREAGALQRRPVHRQVRNSPGSLFQVFTTQGFHTGHSWQATRPFPKRSLFFFPVFVPFYFLWFFLKNTLLQELENTQKQIEEHQHDKVNAAAGICPGDGTASLPAPG